MQYKNLIHGNMSNLSLICKGFQIDKATLLKLKILRSVHVTYFDKKIKTNNILNTY